MLHVGSASDVSQTTTAGASASHDEVFEEDDPQTKFYKRHMKRSQTPQTTGRSPIYNFDAWNDAHYGKTFAKSQEARKKYNSRVERKTLEENIFKNELLLLGSMVVLALILGIYSSADRSHDVTKDTKQTNR